jgi:hypothetical protein
MAAAYADFVGDNTKLWSMLLEPSLASHKDLPAWYHETINRTIASVDHLLRRLIADRKQPRRAVAALWATSEGHCMLTTPGMLSIVSDTGPHALVRLLVSRFLDSLQSKALKT